MDCEKFEATLRDELYGELYELTLAASKRHAAGCARCAALIAGLRATRKVVTLPVLTPSEGFEGGSSPRRSRRGGDEADDGDGAGHLVGRTLGDATADRDGSRILVLMLRAQPACSSRDGRPDRRSTPRASSFTVTENGAPCEARRSHRAPLLRAPPLRWIPRPQPSPTGRHPWLLRRHRGFAAKSAPAFAAGPGAPTCGLASPPPTGWAAGAGSGTTPQKPRAIGRAPRTSSPAISARWGGARQQRVGEAAAPTKQTRVSLHHLPLPHPRRPRTMARSALPSSNTGRGTTPRRHKPSTG